LHVCDLNPEYCASNVSKPEPLKCTDGELTISHDWRPKAWVIWDDWWEVPEYYPPRKAIRVEVCAQCGFMRVPPEDLKEVVEQGK